MPDTSKKMIQEAVQQAVAHARAQVQVEKFNLDGSPVRATDSAEPPPAKYKFVPSTPRPPLLPPKDDQTK